MNECLVIYSLLISFNNICRSKLANTTASGNSLVAGVY